MTQPIQRRLFLMALVSTSATVGTLAHAQALVDENDTQAVALGYVTDAKRVDIKKFPKSPPGRSAPCALYQGKATDKAAGCPFFGTKGSRTLLVQRVGQEGMTGRAPGRLLRRQA